MSEGRGSASHSLIGPENRAGKIGLQSNANT
jgi:hypothetical protein